MIKIQSFVFGPFMENTYILSDETRESIIIDPGCYESEEKALITSYIEDNQLNVVKLLNTHCHIDHVLGNYFIKEKYKVSLGTHQLEEPLLKAVKAYSHNYGFPNYTEAEIDYFIEEGDVIKFGQSQLQVLFVPGHSPGHIAFFQPEQKFCIGGDVLFQGSIGRTDLPGGNFDTLIQSIHQKFFPLGDDVTVYCGHGSSTTVGEEKKSNPFCAINMA
ncbi:MBL fold metallo-hydrolase [Fulvivirgaceae bacterium BMA12]|uniref:MBL fold metallo-hydrolase n=1 Tax=Agaribacillus aureus TaxID=3051825 RepID=A0ABT8LEY9_9BACT|nr:MBL fold metallo-hydrolase [Fulvivirgaceae bacterium BMA12]